MHSDVIVLNGDFSFLGFISWKKALSLICLKKVEILKESEKIVNTFKGKMKIPAIIRLMKTIRAFYKKEVPFSKKNIFIRDDYKCQYCGKKLSKTGKDKPTIDHIIPVSRGGISSWTNCVCSCKKCNLKKGFKLLRELDIHLLNIPWKPTINEFILIKTKNLGIEKIISDFWESFT